MLSLHLSFSLTPTTTSDPFSELHTDILSVTQGPKDLEDDITAGFDLIHTFDYDDHGVAWISEKIKRRVGNGPVVISLDVDVMDPSVVPAST
jgi:agmatinase